MYCNKASAEDYNFNVKSIANVCFVLFFLVVTAAAVVVVVVGNTHLIIIIFLLVFYYYLLRTVVESVIRCILLSFSLCCDVELFIRI